MHNSGDSPLARPDLSMCSASKVSSVLIPLPTTVVYKHTYGCVHRYTLPELFVLVQQRWDIFKLRGKKASRNNYVNKS